MPGLSTENLLRNIFAFGPLRIIISVERNWGKERIFLIDFTKRQEWEFEKERNIDAVF